MPVYANGLRTLKSREKGELGLPSICNAAYPFPPLVDAALPVLVRTKWCAKDTEEHPARSTHEAPGGKCQETRNARWNAFDHERQ